jgi:hypothetical protein
VKQRDIRKLKTAEMKFMSNTAGYSLLDQRRNEDTVGEFKGHLVENKSAQYKQKWINHISGMEDITLNSI